jgi:hypothetical protein
MRKNGPTIRTRQLAEAVLTASGNDARLSALNESTASRLLATLQTALPNATPECRAVMEELISDELKTLNTMVTEINIDIFSAKFTDAQLLDMMVFYRSEGGQALVAQTPAIIREKTELGRKLNAEMVPRLLAEACSRTACADTSPTSTTP